jgi:hypothetical protein
MHVVVEHVRPAAANLTEINCAASYRRPVQIAIRNVTGQSPLAIEMGQHVLFVSDGLTMDEGIALLELVIDQRRDPVTISRNTLTEHEANRQQLIRLRSRCSLDCEGFDPSDYADPEVGV